VNRALQIAHLALLIAATALIGAAAWRGILLARDIDALVGSMNATLTNINRPCQGPAGPNACGTLAQVNKVAIAAGDVANASKMQVEQSGDLIKATTANIDAIGATVTKAADHLSGTADALAETAHGATDAIATTNQSIAGLQPLEIAATASVSHLDTVIADPAIPATLGNTAKITSDSARITKDAADEADKLAHPPLKKMGFWATIDGIVLYFHSHIAPPIF